MGTKIGGWTRIWIVFSALFLVFGIWVWRSDANYGKDKADAAYKSQVDSIAFCADAHTKGEITPSQPFDKWIGCDGSSLQSEPAARAVRDQTIFENNKIALRNGLTAFCWPSAVIGVLFAGVGWIRSGFRRRPV